jgi:hypothetical protein
MRNGVWLKKADMNHLFKRPLRILIGIIILNLKLILANFGPQDRVFLGSHNLESVEIAKKIIKRIGVKRISRCSLDN